MPHHPPFPRIAHQRHVAINAVHEFAIGHGDEQRKHHAEMQRQQRAHRRRRAQKQQRHARKTGQEQHHDEGDIHAEPGAVDQIRIALVFFHQQPGGPDQQSDAADRAQHHRQVPPRIRRLHPQQIMIQRRDRGRGETQPKTVERQVMIDLAPVVRPLVLVDAADPAAVEIAQLTGVLHRLPQRGRIGLHPDGLADIAPERAHTHDKATIA